MSTKAVHPNTLRGIKQLKTVSFIRQAYLVGGTALALQKGHSISIDLDFFTQAPFVAMEVAALLRDVRGFTVDHVSSKTIVGTIFDTNFSLFYYPYDIIKPFAQFEGIHILDVSDIAAMKLHALEDRGTRRDFVDIYILTKDFTLEEMFEFYEKKYHCLDDHIYSLVKSLSYFTNAEHDTQMPHMLVDIK